MNDSNHETHGKSLVRLMGRYVTEILIIFIGITISFMFDKWREERNERQKEIEFIESLEGDLTFKHDEIKNESESISKFLSNTEFTLSLVKERKILPDTLIDYLLTFYDDDNNFFSPSTPTFNASVATEPYQKLPDSLRRSMFGLYSVFDFLRLHYESSAKARFDFKLNHMALAGVPFSREITRPDGSVVKNSDYESIRHFFNSAEFINNLCLIRNYEFDKYSIMARSAKRIDRLMKSLKAYKQMLR